MLSANIEIIEFDSGESCAATSCLSRDYDDDNDVMGLLTTTVTTIARRSIGIHRSLPPAVAVAF